MSRLKVYIKNEQDKLEFLPEYEQIIKKVAETVLTQEEILFSCEVSVLITDNEYIRTLNAKYRGKDTPTDVLSFPMLEVNDEGIILAPEPPDEQLLLGDIVISIERAAEQADEFGHSLRREIGFLTAHSMLHLLGYDHETGENERQVMREKEERALDSLGLTR